MAEILTPDDEPGGIVRWLRHLPLVLAAGSIIWQAASIRKDIEANDATHVAAERIMDTRIKTLEDAKISEQLATIRAQLDYIIADRTRNNSDGRKP
jgi:hypothetical protein